MLENIDKAVDRGVTLTTLTDKAKSCVITDSAKELQKTRKQIRRKMRCQEYENKVGRAQNPPPLSPYQLSPGFPIATVSTASTRIYLPPVWFNTVGHYSPPWI
ncbi:Synaptobrevin [Forsythia ovata]|uniref:Synaptobrevin n=1 Tax=Forsythia ovata TaxID=205694 RepID=A0ABD1P5U5_9LAMI